MKESIYFNSWDTNYRFPFGAVKEESYIDFTIEINMDAVIYVGLVLLKDGHWDTPMDLQMYKIGKNLYKVRANLTKGSGLYFYHFKIIQNNEKNVHLYHYGACADGRGGEGKLYRESQKPHDYQITCYQNEDAAPKWYRDAVVYHIFVDRFFNGEPNEKVLNPRKNTFIYATQEDTPYYIRNEHGEIDRWDFFGGNLRGIIKKIPYLKGLGVTVVYLSPIFQARSNHKYDTGNYFEIDSMFGDLATFEELIKELHAADIRVILDGVFSHVGQDSLYFNSLGTYPEVGAYQSQASPYYDWFTFQKYPEEYTCWWGVKDMPNLNKSNPEVQEYIYGKKNSVVEYWGSKGIDGWRLDVVDELPTYFLQGIRHRMDTLNSQHVLIGEVWEDASNKEAYGERRHYVEGDTLHGAMNYPFRKILLELLEEKESPSNVARSFMALKENYPRHFLFNNLNNISTHDTKRILTELDEQMDLFKMVVGLFMTLPGVPCIYYGDEAGLRGMENSKNRKFYPWGREEEWIYAYYRKWIEIRKTDSNLRYGDFFPFYSEHIFGFIRYKDEFEFSIIMINLAREELQLASQELHILGTNFEVEQVIRRAVKEVKIGARDLFYKKNE